MSVFPVPMIAALKGASSTPPPDFTNTVSAWGLNNWNPVGYPSGTALSAAGDGGDDAATFYGTAPYALDTADSIPNWGNPPYLVTTWYDQNGSTNNVLTSTAQPTLDAVNKQITFNGSSNGLQGANPLYA